MSKVKILVPYDFSKVADAAVSYSEVVAKKYGGEIYFLNIVSKTKQIEPIRKRLISIADKVKERSGLSSHVMVHLGNIFDDIGELALELAADIIVMGTHGARGIQKVTGSHVLKVICDSEVPYLVVQKDNTSPDLESNFKNIVITINYSKKSKQKLLYIAGFAKKFSSTVHMLYTDSSSSEVKNKILRELKFAKEYLTERKIEVISKKIIEKDFEEEFLDYSKEVKADLFAIVNEEDGSVLPDFFGSRELKMITNSLGIPIIVVNPKKGVMTSGVIGS